MARGRSYLRDHPIIPNIERPHEHVPFILDADDDVTTLVCMVCTADLSIVVPLPEPTQAQVDKERGRVRPRGYLKDQE